MDRSKELKFLGVQGIRVESALILKQAHRSFILTTLTLVLPLCGLILFHSHVSQPLLATLVHLDLDVSWTSKEWAVVMAAHFLLLLCICLFLFLTTAVVSFTVATLYSSGKPVSSWLPSLIKFPLDLYRTLPHLRFTFLWFWIPMIVSHKFFSLLVWCLIDAIKILDDKVLTFLSIVSIIGSFIMAPVYVPLVWYLVNIVTVLEPGYGIDAIGEALYPLTGRELMGSMLVLGYFIIGGVISRMSHLVETNGATLGTFVLGQPIQAILYLVLLLVVVLVNVFWSIVLSVFYHVCKSYQNANLPLDSSDIFYHVCNSYRSQPVSTRQRHI
ncbi:hypothetical protein CDL15_Pgr004241 [Punica granatum]|uniref:Uncharacterized protein n=1 Tax=Punica granatum TaxID=22663 RepID=A0A218XGD2_PUNGR|nr:hypothetical protein CDL15_Pgr004241 [Punica granatum]PKI34693.1 hypothetical protein CRG98_044926 [Punica granatum]